MAHNWCTCVSVCVCACVFGVCDCIIKTVADYIILLIYMQTAHCACESKRQGYPGKILQVADIQVNAMDY